MFYELIANTFKDTERRLKTPNQFEAFSRIYFILLANLEFEEEKMGIDHLENAFELFSESKSNVSLLSFMSTKK